MLTTTPNYPHHHLDGLAGSHPLAHAPTSSGRRVVGGRGRKAVPEASVLLSQGGPVGRCLWAMRRPLLVKPQREAVGYNPRGMQALIFDLDGTILDTESSEFRSWQEVYRDYGAELSLDYWLPFVGNNSLPFDPVGHLETLLGTSLDREEIEARVERRRDELNRELKPLPGVLEYIEAARAMGLGLALASSSSRAWVEEHLRRLGLLSAFQVICTKEDVPLTKPDPALFLRAAEALGVQPRQALAIEDSLNGVRAARAAGAFTVAVPNAITRHLDLSEADLVLSRLDDLPLWELVRIARGRRLFPVV